MKHIAMGTLLFVVSTFMVQAASHFVINAAHYASIGFLRPEPTTWLGLLIMVVQGMVLSYLYRFYRPPGYSQILRGWTFSMLACLFLVGYIALVEPAKYQVPSIAAWAIIEGSAGLVQFSLFGLALGLLVRKDEKQTTAF